MQALLAVALAVVFAAAAWANEGGSNLEIVTLSNRADLISGGDALVEVRVPKQVSLSAVKVKLNGHDITASFKANAAARTLRGLVTGLVEGRNDLVAEDAGKGHGKGDGKEARLTITNHPIGGPVLLGSQTQPWVCATPTPVAQSGNTPASNASGLTTFAVDAQCNIATEYKLFYRTTTVGCSTALPDPSPPAAPPTNNCFKPYTPGSAPADLATTTTTAGLTVPYIVRVERGTLNRGIYDIAVLFDPNPATPAWTALTPQPQWNRKVVYSFGASTGQPRLQFRSEQNWADDAALSRGFMVVDNSLTDSLYDSNRTLEAETLMMMKEHIVDAYGQIAYTVGNGCSGGSIGQNTAASIFPGLLDGIQPSCDYPDSITTGLEVGDCVLLVNFYAGPDWTALMTSTGQTQAQINAKKRAINGHMDATSCHGWYNSFGNNNRPGNYIPKFVLSPTGIVGTPPGTAARNNCLLPASLVYDPVSNPDGTRCGDPDLATAVWGTTGNENAPGHLRARQTSDNVGIQYGLGALLSGAITAEEFVTLNEKIGGTDADSNPRAARTTADLDALPIAYRAGIVSSGRNLGKLPIIDSRGFDEAPPPLGAFGIHYIWRSFAERARIDADNGDHGNQVMWRYGTGLLPGTPAQVAAVTLRSFLTMDTWLSALNTSAPKATLNSVRTHEQVVAAKPVGTVDFCFLSTDPTFSTPVFDMAVCDADFPQGDGLGRLAKRASPRQVAGGPLAENILKCRLKPLNPVDYAPVTFTSAQWTRLQTTFADGVCDWSERGVGQRRARSPLTFADGPGGEPLPKAPRSHPGNGHDDDHDDHDDHGHGHDHDD
jgi:hypothetical protein